MAKQIIAVDLDDVLASSAQGFVDFSNLRWGTKLTVEDYDEHWQEMWGIDNAEATKRANIIYAAGFQKHYERLDDAQLVLKKLSKQHRLVITTARHRRVEKITYEWLEQHFKGVFDDIHFAGIWDNGHDPEVAINLTKAALCQKVGASYLIDDHPKHCFAAAKVGVKALLFGDYRWNRHLELPNGVVRTKNWKAVGDYFNV